MHYNLTNLAILFFCYSFLGWGIETSVASVKHKCYRNRGFLSGPFCLIYGFSGIVLSTFLYELRSAPFFLFLGSAIISTFIEWMTGRLLEQVRHKKWWDYSKKRWNLDGYICLQYSILWGILGYIAIQWGNTLILWLWQFIPTFVTYIILWTLTAICCMDITASVLTILHLEHKSPTLIRLNRELFLFKTSFGRALTAHIRRRIQKAYPATATDKVISTSATKLPFSEFIWLFILGAFLGDIVETIFCRLTVGVWMSRSSVVWGPFSIVWGLAIALVTTLLFKSKGKSDRHLFILGTLLGGAYEYSCSVFTEIVFGKVFWDYSHIPFNLGGRINLLYCFFWGFAAVIWFKNLYPILHHVIERILHRSKYLLTTVGAVFMICNIIVSMLALIRYDTREHSPKPKAHWEEVMDHYYPDETMRKIYPNAK